MTAGQQMLLAGRAAPPIKANAYAVSNIGAGVRTGSITFNNDGTTTTNPASAAPNWLAPTTAGVGSQWSAKVTLVSQSNTSFGGNLGVGFWLPLSAGGTVSFTNQPGTVRANGSGTVQFSPDGGATIIDGGTITWQVGP